MREEEAAPTLERIHIEAGRVGKRAASVGERIGTVQLGTAVAPKKAEHTKLSVQTRELGTSLRRADMGQTKVKVAFLYLNNRQFADAQRTFAELLQEI